MKFGDFKKQSLNINKKSINIEKKSINIMTKSLDSQIDSLEVVLELIHSKSKWIEFKLILIKTGLTLNVGSNRLLLIVLNIKWRQPVPLRNALVKRNESLSLCPFT